MCKICVLCAYNLCIVCKVDFLLLFTASVYEEEEEEKEKKEVKEDEEKKEKQGKRRI